MSQLIYSTSTVQHGNLDFRFGPADQVVASRERFLSDLNLDLDSLVCMKVQQGNEVVEVTNDHLASGARDNHGIEADALVTKQNNLVLGLLTADCVPIFIWVQNSDWIGLIHGGRQSLDLGIISNTLELLTQNQVDLTDLQVFLGPHIMQRSYCLDSAPAHLNSDWGEFVETKTDKSCCVDMTGFCLKSLTDLGIQETNISISDIDTYSSPDFFSHRQAEVEGVEKGRVLSVLVRQN